MKNIINKINNIKSDLYCEVNSTKLDQFFKSSILNMSVSLEVGTGHFNDKFLSFEIICQNIPKKIASRSSIQGVLNEGVKLGYFIKKYSDKDRRVKLYFYSKEYSEMISKWIDYHESNIIEFDVA